MLKWSVIFLLLSIIFGVFGFTLIAGVAASIAKVLFFVFLVMLVVFISRGISGYRRINR